MGLDLELRDQKIKKSKLKVLARLFAFFHGVLLESDSLHCYFDGLNYNFVCKNRFCHSNNLKL